MNINDILRDKNCQFCSHSEDLVEELSSDEMWEILSPKDLTSMLRTNNSISFVIYE